MCNQFRIYDLFRPIPDAVHAPDPLHLILCFELFRDALGSGHLPDYQFKLPAGLSINLPQIIAQFAGGEKISICNAPVLLQPAEVPLAPDSDCWPLVSFPGDQIVVALQLVLQAGSDIRF